MNDNERIIELKTLKNGYKLQVNILNKEVAKLKEENKLLELTNNRLKEKISELDLENNYMNELVKRNVSDMQLECLKIENKNLKEFVAELKKLYFDKGC